MKDGPGLVQLVYAKRGGHPNYGLVIWVGINGVKMEFRAFLPRVVFIEQYALQNSIGSTMKLLGGCCLVHDLLSSIPLIMTTKHWTLTVAYQTGGAICWDGQTENNKY